MTEDDDIPFFKPITDDEKENDEETNNIPDYDDIGNIDVIKNDERTDIQDIHENIDNIPIGHYKKLQPSTETIDEPELPEQLGTVLTKYRVEAEIPQSQRKNFESNRSFHGRHVALSNTKRIDNIRHLDAQDLCNIFDRIPTMRHQATIVRMRETAEFQMCRSNPEIGGFEAKIGVTNIRREDVDVRQTQSLTGDNKKKKSKGFFGFGKKSKDEGG